MLKTRTVDSDLVFAAPDMFRRFQICRVFVFLIAQRLNFVDRQHIYPGEFVSELMF